MQYPVIMENTNNGIVVCFSSSEAGHVVKGNEDYQVGRYMDNVVSAEDTTHWKPYVAPVPQVEVFEVIYKANNGRWLMGSKLLTEEELQEDYIDNVKTGRSFFVDADGY